MAEQHGKKWLVPKSLVTTCSQHQAGARNACPRHSSRMRVLVPVNGASVEPAGPPKPPRLETQGSSERNSEMGACGDPQDGPTWSLNMADFFVDVFCL